MFPSPPNIKILFPPLWVELRYAHMHIVLFSDQSHMMWEAGLIPVLPSLEHDFIRSCVYYCRWSGQPLKNLLLSQQCSLSTAH